MCKGEWSSRRHAVGDEGAEVAERSWDIRLEADECPERTYFVHRLAWSHGEPRFAVT
jgi:hypothetical protein